MILTGKRSNHWVTTKEFSLILTNKRENGVTIVESYELALSKASQASDIHNKVVTQ